MKSLDIVNVHLGFFIQPKHISCTISMGELEIIKQDLEVLEILRKHLWVSEKWIGSEIKSDLDASTEEEYNKVKQWLEVNENER